MKNIKPTIGLVSGTPTPTAKQLCEELAQQGISVMVKAKTEPVVVNEQLRQLAGQPGQDLFFNSWKLLF